MHDSLFHFLNVSSLTSLTLILELNYVRLAVTQLKLKGLPRDPWLLMEESVIHHMSKINVCCILNALTTTTWTLMSIMSECDFGNRRWSLNGNIENRMKGRSCQPSLSLSTKIYSKRRGHVHFKANLRINRWQQYQLSVSVKLMSYNSISSINSNCQHEVNELNKRYSMDTHSTHVGSLLNLSCDWWVSTFEGSIFKFTKQIGRGIKLKQFTERHLLN